MKKYIIVILLMLTTNAMAANDESCNILLNFEKDISKKLPIQTDAVTTVVEVAVNCTNRSVKYVKHLKVNKKMLSPGAADRKQRQYLNLHCNKTGLATQGWTAIDHVYDNELSLIMTLVAKPAMCS